MLPIQVGDGGSSDVWEARGKKSAINAKIHMDGAVF